MLNESITRRMLLSAGTVTATGLSLSPWLDHLLAAQSGNGRAKAKRCILVWLNGGPSHIDTLDPKPGSKTNGPFKPISTKITGAQFSEHLPKLAGIADKLAVVRSLTSREADHERAYRFVHTGALQPGTKFPTLGSVVSEEKPGGRNVPVFVAIGDNYRVGPGFLGLNHAPFRIGGEANAVEHLHPPEDVDEDRDARRFAALKSLDAGFSKRSGIKRIREYVSVTETARRMKDGPLAAAVDLEQEKSAVRSRYGFQENNEERTAAAMPFLLARRLIERGVRFVELMVDGWDTHTNNFAATESLCSVLDPALTALITDLAARGLLEETLVVCLGEFGRTPQINESRGRDHWPKAFSMLLAGGGVRGGQVVGSTDARGAEVKKRPVTVPDIYATLLTSLGIDITKKYRTPAGRPIRLADGGKVVSELFA